jgi:hypothetical protein
MHESAMQATHTPILIASGRMACASHFVRDDQKHFLASFELVCAFLALVSIDFK